MNNKITYRLHAVNGDDLLVTDDQKFIIDEMGQLFNVRLSKVPNLIKELDLKNLSFNDMLDFAHKLIKLSYGDVQGLLINEFTRDNILETQELIMRGEITLQ